MAPYRDVHSNHGEERLAIQSTAGGNAGARVCTCVHARTHAHNEQMNPTFLHSEGWDLFSFCVTAMKGWLVRPQRFLHKIKPEKKRRANSKMACTRAGDFLSATGDVLRYDVVKWSIYYLKITSCMDCWCKSGAHAADIFVPQMHMCIENDYILYYRLLNPLCSVQH